MRTLTIAAIQTTPVPYDIAASWERFSDQVHAVRGTFPPTCNWSWCPS